jgi:hypothetical protein
VDYQNIQLFVLIIPASLLLLGIGFIILSLGMGAMQLLVARHFLTHYPDGDMFDRALSIAYITIIIYTLVRPIVIFFFSSPDNFGELIKSNYWLLMLSASILLSLWLFLRLQYAA